MGVTCIKRIIHVRMRNAKSREAVDKRRKRGSDAMSNMKKAKRLTLGIMVSNGIHTLNSHTFIVSSQPQAFRA